MIAARMVEDPAVWSDRIRTKRSLYSQGTISTVERCAESILLAYYILTTATGLQSKWLDDIAVRPLLRCPQNLSLVALDVQRMIGSSCSGHRS